MFKSDECETSCEKETLKVEDESTVKDISDPIYLLVEKLLANPKLLKIVDEVYSPYGKEWYLTLPILSLEGILSNTYGSFKPFKVILGGLDITDDESAYLIDKLYNIYDTRAERYRELKCQRSLREYRRSQKAKRITIQKKLETM